MCASAILRFARTIRLPIVGSATRNARAISPVVRPPSARSVSATRAGISSAGWQQVKISRSRSSTIVLSSSMVGSSCWASRRVSSASRSARSATDRSRRRRSIARRRAAVVIHAPGLAGTPSRRHAVTARLERVLHGVLGELEVAGLPDQGGQHDRPLLAERLGDRGRDRRRRRSRQVSSRPRPTARRRAGAPSPTTPRPARPGAPRSSPSAPAGSARPARAPRRGRRTRRGSSRPAPPWSPRTGRRRSPCSPSRTRTVVALSVDRSAFTFTSTPASRRLRCSSRNHGTACVALGLAGLVDLLLIHQQHVLSHRSSNVGRPHPKASLTTTSPLAVAFGQSCRHHGWARCESGCCGASCTWAATPTARPSSGARRSCSRSSTARRRAPGTSAMRCCAGCSGTSARASWCARRSTASTARSASATARSSTSTR